MSKKSLASVEKSLNDWLKPKLLAESWDNVGLLIGSGRSSKSDKTIDSILCCNDLTSSVVTEAITSKVDMIIAYHPPIFSPLKAVAYNSWKEEIVARCLGHDICLYSPHTTLDAVIGGINDRIMESLRTIVPYNDSTLDTITPACLDNSRPGISFKSTSENITALYDTIPLNDVTVSFDVRDVINGNGNTTSLCVYPLLTAGDTLLDEIKELAASLNIAEFKDSSVITAPPAVLGSGRILRFSKAVNIEQIVESLRKCTGVPTIKLAEGSRKEVTSIALCVGSGASILKGLDVDVLITGEMTHHDVLDCLEAGQSIILCGHAASERHYLPTLAATVKIVTQCPNVNVSKEEKPIFRFV